MSERLWVDANVLLRYLTGDPPEQAKRSAALIARVERGDLTLALHPVVLAEVYWVLRSFYGYSAADIAGALVPLLSADGIDAPDRELTIAAVELARDKRVDFVDALLALHAERASESVCTSDAADFRRLPGRWSPPA